MHHFLNGGQWYHGPLIKRGVLFSKSTENFTSQIQKETTILGAKSKSVGTPDRSARLLKRRRTRNHTALYEVVPGSRPRAQRRQGAEIPRPRGSRESPRCRGAATASRQWSSAHAKTRISAAAGVAARHLNMRRGVRLREWWPRSKTPAPPFPYCGASHRPPPPVWERGAIAIAPGPEQRTQGSEPSAASAEQRARSSGHGAAEPLRSAACRSETATKSALSRRATTDFAVRPAQRNRTETHPPTRDGCAVWARSNAFKTGLCKCCSAEF